MNTLKLLRDHQHEAEYDTAVLIDDHDRARRAALFLAHHPVLRAAVLLLASPAIAATATWWAIRETWRVTDRVHEVRGEDGTICGPCALRDARVLNSPDEFTIENFVGLCDLAELRPIEGGEWQ